MALQEELETQGNFLFRWRTYIPGLILILSFYFVSQYSYVGFRYANHLLWVGFCIFVSMIGFFVRAFTIGFTPRDTSGRNTKEQVASTVNNTGIYSWIRHPLYVGNFFLYFGVVLIPMSFTFAVIYILFFFLYYERIAYAEEQFLRKKFGEAYTSWANATPAVLPNFRNYRKPPLSFSLKNVIKREYPTFFGVLFVFLVYDVITLYLNFPVLAVGGVVDLLQAHHWIWLGVSLGGYAVCRILVKFTKVLVVEGR